MSGLRHDSRQYRGKLVALVFAGATLLALSAMPRAEQTARLKRDGIGGNAIDKPAQVAIDAGEVKARIALSQARASSGKPLRVTVDFDISPGWHVYGKPLPEGYTPTSVSFDNDLLSGQQLVFPKPTPVKFELLGETLPVYQGRFSAAGDVLLRQNVAPGDYQLSGTLGFQECNDNLCKMPQQVRFEIPLRVDAPGAISH
jgi:DsbC/DsbD-like thiol-disulfide interchange protein